jgi:2-hydroxychromene-2-carboxylate isomerase
VPTIVVYFDYVSPFAYMLAEVLPAKAEAWGAALDWRPIELLALSSFEGGLPYSEKKRAYVFVDAARTAEYLGVEIQPPRPFPVEPALARRVAVVAGRHGRFDAFHPILFRAAWRDQHDVSHEAVMRECIARAGGEPDAWLAEADAPDVHEAIARNTAEAEAAGVFGVPTLVLDGELFWGVDSLPVLGWRLTGQRS